MWYSCPLLFLGTVLYTSQLVFGLGSSCIAPLGAGTAGPADPYWLESIQHQGTSPFYPNSSSYQVFRNVKEYGAKGDGVTDDTAAIKAAMSSGGRCGARCGSSTYVAPRHAVSVIKYVTRSISPAIVYFPQGTYLVSSAIDAYYYTQIIGDARHPPTLLASSHFIGSAVIGRFFKFNNWRRSNSWLDADPYIPNGWGAQWYINQDNLFRSVRNLIIDLRQVPLRNTAIGLHWQVAQATSLINVVVEMSTASGTNHQVTFLYPSSGGFMGGDNDPNEDTLLNFHPGKIGIEVGNQQFTVRNLTVNHAVTGEWSRNRGKPTLTRCCSAVSGLWNWGFTFQGVTINNCHVGFALSVGGTTLARQVKVFSKVIRLLLLTKHLQGVGSEVIVDAVVRNTPVFVQSSVSSNGTLPYSLVLNNIQLSNVSTAVGIAGGAIILSGGNTTIASWGQGNVYSGTSGHKNWTRGHPQYASYATNQIISVKSHGARGDGKTDDTRAIQKIFNQYSGCKIIFFDAGVYYVTKTITIPAGTQIVGEAWSVILAGGRNFQSQRHPRPVIRAGTAGSRGMMEISDLLLTTVGPAPGAILIEWNIHDPVGQQGAAGLWDTHIRLGGAAGTNLQYAQCPSGSVNPSCQAAFLGIHLTRESNAYFEGTWVWTADHDLDGSGQTSVFTGRGILSESAGPVWLIGTSEHAALYQYNLVTAENHYIGFVQTETPYYQPVPAAPAPFRINPAYHDPTYPDSINAAWAMYIKSSSNIAIFAPHFAWRIGTHTVFASQNFSEACLTPLNCQHQIFNIDSASAPTVTVYGLSTVGATYQLSVDQDGVVDASSNLDGFQDTLTAWHY
ncbi:glycoside hydrolase family 55 protein [Lanmaoa asiatica]|nr:glycoside hydrolase family 55 protein [Lanmaoa asiatica]